MDAILAKEKKRDQEFADLKELLQSKKYPLLFCNEVIEVFGGPSRPFTLATGQSCI